MEVNRSRVLQSSCKVVTALQGCEHLAQNSTILLQPYKLVARLLQSRNFHMDVHMVMTNSLGN